MNEPFNFDGELGSYTIYSQNLITLWYQRPLRYKVATKTTLEVLGEVQIGGKVEHVFAKIRRYRRDELLDELVVAYLDGDRLIIDQSKVYTVLWATNYTAPKTGFSVKNDELFFGDGIKVHRIATLKRRKNSQAFYESGDMGNHIIHYRFDGSVKCKLNHEGFSKTLVFPIELTVSGSLEEQDAWNRYLWPHIYCDFIENKPTTGKHEIGQQILNP